MTNNAIHILKIRETHFINVNCKSISWDGGKSCKIKDFFLFEEIMYLKNEY